MFRQTGWIVWVVVLIIWIGPWRGAWAQDRPFVLTLQDAIQVGLKQNETVLIAQQEVEKAGGQIGTAWAEAFPKLSFNGFYTRNWETPAAVFGGRVFRFGTTNVLNGGATLTIPLYKGGKTLAARRVAHAFREYTDASLTNTRQQVAFDIQRAFYGVLLANELVTVNESALKQAEAHLEQVVRLHKVGTASDYDLLRAQVQVANLKPAVITARNNRDMAVLALKNVIGLDLNASIDTRGSLAEAAVEQLPETSDVESTIRLALKNRPDLAAMEYRLDMLEDAVRIQAGEMRPTVNVISNYQTQAQLNDLQGLKRDQFVNSYSSRLVFDIPVFDGRKSHGEVTRARADLMETEYARRRLQKNAELEVRQAFMRVQEARERLTAQQETVAQAQKGLDIAEVRYRTGVGTQLETLDAQLVLTQARTNQAQGLNDYVIAVAGLKKAIGTGK